MRKSKNIITLFTLILVLFVCVCSCGLPNVNFFDDLNPPTNLEIIEYNKGKYIDITFMSSNSEINFTGFNIYISEHKDGMSTSAIRKKAKDHVVDDGGMYKRDTEIEDEFIIKNNESDIPSIKSEDILNYYNEKIAKPDEALGSLSEKTDACCVGGEVEYDIGQINPDTGEICRHKLRPFEYKFRIEKLPNGKTIDARDRYYIVVTAYDESAFIESNPSNVTDTEDF